MAGLAALMTRKKRDRRRELEQLKEKLADPVAMAELTGKEAEEAMRAKAAHETIKKILIGKELLHQKSQKSFDGLSQLSYQDKQDGGDDLEGDGTAKKYKSIYIGLILICIGVVITFVGLGEKGFKTVQLKMIGPIFVIVGFSSVVIKVLQCTFPHLFTCFSFIPPGLRRKKLAQANPTQTLLTATKDKAINNMEKGGELTPKNRQPTSTHNSNGVTRKSTSKMKEQNKSSSSFDTCQVYENSQNLQHNEMMTTQPPPPSRVILRSKKPDTATGLGRPKSTIPNYIEGTSDEDDLMDEFNPPQRKWTSDSQKQENTRQSPEEDKEGTLPSHGQNNKDKKQPSIDELILSAQGLLL